MIESAFETLWNTPIEEYCANDMGYNQMLRLMNLNAQMRETISNNLGNGVLDGVNKVSDETYEYDYTYTDEVNYLNNYQRTDASKTTTSVDERNDNMQNYNSHNRIYGQRINTYYDDNGTGYMNFADDAKTNFYEANRNKNSAIYKTKKLFECKKVNTIISRFYTDTDKNISSVSETANTKNYGMSHGRNLLTYDAERNGRAYNRNGYDDPYCRVWTHHHQYTDLRARLIRPFSIENEDGTVSVMKTSKLHDWKEFEDVKDGYFKQRPMEGEAGVIAERTKWGWKQSGADGYKLSVLNNENGIVNIVPKFRGGAEKNIHTKDCMFSIENLAWQGYDPYSFERALSWEQRGPFGGRIMWFPPYGLRFNEDTSVQWNEHSFIGRGENVYTYTNTSRSGTLEFMMVVDHPSIIDYATWHNPDDLKDTDILRFFAGCDGGDKRILQSFAKPTPLTDEYIENTNVTKIDVTENEKPEQPVVPEVPMDEEIELSFYVFYPNNYSGYFDRKADSKVDPIAYLLAGNGAQWKCNVDDVKQSQVLPIDFKDLNESESLGNGYEMKDSRTQQDQQDSNWNYIIGTGYPNGYGKNKYIQNNNKRWYYRIDGEYVNGISYSSVQNTFGQTLRHTKSYQDTQTLGLNYDIDSVKSVFSEEKNTENLYTLAEIAYALSNDWEIEEETNNQKVINSKSGGKFSKTNDRIKRLIELFDTRNTSPYKVIELHGIGYSNSHGSNSVNTTNAKRNLFLAKERCSTALNWFLINYGTGSLSIKSGSETATPSVPVDPQDKQDESGRSAKKWRSAKVTVKIKKSAVVETQDLNQENTEQTTEEWVRFSGFKELGRKTTINGRQYDLYVNINETEPSKKDRPWYYDEETKQMVLLEKSYSTTNRFNINENGDMETNGKDVNYLRYDQEYYFFKQLEVTHPDVFASLKEKVQYFDPVFHSMTPEGFMGRLNFLQQCTRQGDTIGASDENGHSANNLAFGRPPFCILRLGDFYYQKIVIKNINISYDPLVLDLNQEGIGVVPLIANVTISFNFIGGGDLTGPVRRLQNAMSFNYYANGRLYDNRSDRVEHEKTNWETMGAMDNNKVDFNKSYFHHVQMASH